MRARIVHESMYGNTAAIAAAIAAGLSEYFSVETVNVADAAESPLSAVDLLVVGGPTHAFGLSRPQSRQDAARRVETPIVTEVGIREWIRDAERVTPGARAAAFGTRLARPRWLTGSAARGAGKLLRRAGYELATPPMDFLVESTTGPLTTGEVERARIWASRLARAEADRRADHR